MSQKAKSLSTGDVLFGMVIGALIIGPFIWTPVGRSLAISAIQKGAKVTKEKVEEWIKSGEK